MKIKKKLIREWGKIKLLETSAVGIPVYPHAHKSLSNSLVKALRETEPEDELNKGESPMEEDETAKAEESESEVSKSTEEAESESETPEESEETEETEEKKSVEDKKGISKKDMLDMMTKGFQAAIKASETPRGLVAPEVNKAKEMQETIKKMSLGELAIMHGIGKAPDMYGRV